MNFLILWLQFLCTTSVSQEDLDLAGSYLLGTKLTQASQALHADYGRARELPGSSVVVTRRRTSPAYVQAGGSAYCTVHWLLLSPISLLFGLGIA
jgi:hypothetical protein